MVLFKKNLWINIFHYLPHIHDRTSLEILPHWSHEKGFSPVCTLWCLIRLFCMEKLFITLITCEWILPSVYSLIIYKSSSFRINLSTLFTWKWFLPSMYSLLSYKTISYGKKLLSHWSHVNGFSPVCTLWCWNRFDFKGESLLTVFAMKRFLSSMDYLMLE